MIKAEGTRGIFPQTKRFYALALDLVYLDSALCDLLLAVHIDNIHRLADVTLQVDKQAIASNANDCSYYNANACLFSRCNGIKMDG